MRVISLAVSELARLRRGEEVPVNDPDDETTIVRPPPHGSRIEGPWAVSAPVVSALYMALAEADAEEFDLLAVRGDGSFEVSYGDPPRAYLINTIGEQLPLVT